MPGHNIQLVSLGTALGEWELEGMEAGGEAGNRRENKE